jgi:squalene-hopene/tetraprenyl-beta-curcumene cyclase
MMPASALEDKVAEALRRTQAYFLSTQHSGGYWWGELESNPTMEAEYLLLTYYLGSDEGERLPLVVKDIQRRQREDGSWGTYYGAPGDISTSVECYFALKLMGVSPDESAMMRAREFILSQGGLPKVRVFTKVWLALFGQWDWRGTPIMPPEIVLFPTWVPFNLYRFSSWARATIMPLCIVLTQHPTKFIPHVLAIDELYPKTRSRTGYSLPLRNRNVVSLEGLFWVADHALRWYERLPWKPFRRRALRKAEEWIVAHQEADGSWGGIQPPWVYSLIALNWLGYANDHPVIANGLQGFRDKWSLMSDDKESMRVQACLSPVWDTCLAMLGLLDSGLPADHPVLQKAADWLIKEEIRVKGGWAVKAPGLQPSGWAFEFENDMYPDIDDSSIIVMVLNHVRFNDSVKDNERQQVIGRAVAWLLGMQSSNGGWAAFDKDNTDKLVAKIPFSDFGEVLDPPSVDVTAHLLEMLGRLGWTTEHPAVQRALDYIKVEQEKDGCWFGRWGVNYIYGTGAVLPALQAVGEDMSQAYVRRAVEWLTAHQNKDGGWGESCASYAMPSLRGQGESTASQTSWALMALLAAGEDDHPATYRGVAYLVSAQREDGTWDEPQFTGCGFPGYGVGGQPDQYRNASDSTWQGGELGAAFMINYHLYRNYFPLWAMGRYQKTAITS